MKRSSITIIIPVYNVENCVSETLLSVKNQISQPDEVIVINDGSTDRSLSIINNYKDLKGWKIIQTTNQGLGLTRNFGRSIAISEYIYFLDSDDIIKKDLIIRMRSVIEKNNKPDMILFSGETFSDKTTLSKKMNLKLTLSGNYFNGSSLIRKLINRKEAFPQASRYLTKKNLWSKNKLYYPNCIYEDEAVFFPLLALSKKVVVIPEIYVRYRVGRVDSLTNMAPTSRHALSYLLTINLIIEFMSKNPKLVRLNLSAWCYRLGRNGLKYISMCLKTKTPISWVTVLVLFYRVKSISFPIKLLWRFLRHYFTISSNVKKNK